MLRALWAGGPVTHHGRFFDLDDVDAAPGGAAGRRRRAGQPGGPPLLVSGRKAPAMRRAARLGDGWMPYLVSPDAYARSVAHDPRPRRRRPAATWPASSGCSTSTARSGATATGPATTSPRSSAGPTATSRRPCSTASRRPARPTRWRRGSRRTSTPASATSSSRPPPTTDTLEVVTAGGRGGAAAPVAAGARGADAVTSSAGVDAAEAAGLPAPGCRSSRWRSASSDLGLGLAGGVPGMILADLGATRDPGRRRRRRRRSTPACRGAGPGTATSRSSPPTTPTRSATCCATPTSPSSTGRRRWSRAAASAGATCEPPTPTLVYARCRPSRTADGRGRRLRPAGRGPVRVLHPARPATGPVRSSSTCARAGGGRRLPADHVGARPAAPPGARRRRRLGRDVALRRHARHARLHDRPVRAGRARGRGRTGRRARPSPTSCTAAPTAS